MTKLSLSGFFIGIGLIMAVPDVSAALIDGERFDMTETSFSSSESNFGWIEDPISVRIPAEVELNDYLVSDGQWTVSGFSIAEGKIDGVRIEDSILFVDENAAVTSFHVIAYSDAGNETAETEVILYPHYPEILALYDSDENRLERELLIPKAEGEEDGIYRGEITIPDGEGFYRFCFANPDSPLWMYLYCCETMSSNENDKNGRFELCPGSDLPIWLPESFRGETFTFNVNLITNRFEIYQGENPFLQLRITPAEGNPEYAVANRVVDFVFDMNFSDSDISVETDVDGIYIDSSSTSQSHMTVWVRTENWAVDGITPFNIIFKYGGKEQARFPMEARYVSLESVLAPEEMVTHVGEFQNYNVELFPPVVSDNVYLYYGEGYDEVYSMCQIYPDGRWAVVGLESGEGLLYVINDRYEIMATSHITILPREAAVADHIFHALMETGESLNLNLSDHSACGTDGVQWTSSNSGVAMVDENGMVSAVGKGYAVITADCGKHKLMMGIAVNTPTGVGETETDPLRVYGLDGTVYVVGAQAGTPIRIVNPDGIVGVSTESEGEIDKFNVGHGVHLVNVGDSVLKIAM